MYCQLFLQVAVICLYFCTALSQAKRRIWRQVGMSLLVESIALSVSAALTFLIPNFSMHMEFKLFFILSVDKKRNRFYNWSTKRWCGPRLWSNCEVAHVKIICSKLGQNTNRWQSENKAKRKMHRATYKTKKILFKGRYNRKCFICVVYKSIIWYILEIPNLKTF